MKAKAAAKAAAKAEKKRLAAEKKAAKAAEKQKQTAAKNKDKAEKKAAKAAEKAAKMIVLKEKVLRNRPPLVKSCSHQTGCSCVGDTIIAKIKHVRSKSMGKLPRPSGILQDCLRWYATT